MRSLARIPPPSGGGECQIVAMFEGAEVENIDELEDEAPKRKRGRSL
jgi:hypothetical protein